MKIYTVYTNFHSYGGAELIALNISSGLKERGYEVIILSYSKKTKFHKNYLFGDLSIERITFSSFFRIGKNDILISHHRKMTSLFLIWKVLFFKKYTIIHVAHNEFTTLKYFSLFSKKIVAVSNKVKQNLIDYFMINSDRVRVIYNGIHDSQLGYFNKERTKRILIPARVNKVKRQLEIFDELKGKIPDNIEIHFAGVGEDFDELKYRVYANNNSQFKVLGFCSIEDIIREYDFVMLFSKNEGLPTVFIEAFMYSKPIICNNVGGNLEILDDGVNGFCVHNFDELLSIIHVIDNMHDEDYFTMCENARKKYESYFLISKMIDSYEKLILE